MNKALLFLLAATLPAHAAMDITRELEAPTQIVPGQPVRVAITWWTDSWFNPPPQWPEFAVKNGELLNTALPSQLVTRKKNGSVWSGIRLERQVSAWQQGVLRLPAIDITATSANQAPVTVHLPALERPVHWPANTTQADHFLPASQLTLSQQIQQYHAGKDATLRVGDAVDRIVTVEARDALPGQIPPLLYAISGSESQRLAPVSEPLKSERGDVIGAHRVERLRYLPSHSGTLTLPPISLRWWDTINHQWRTAKLTGETLNVAAARQGGAEQALRGTTGMVSWQSLMWIMIAAAAAGGGWFGRRWCYRTLLSISRRWRRFWQPQPLPPLAP